MTLQNLGTDTAHFTGTTSFNIRFSVNDELSGVTLAPQQSLVINVEFQPLNSDTSGAYSGTLTVNSADGRTELAVTGHVPLATRDRITPLPDAVALHVWPNPGNANFQIRFELAHQSNATLSIFDLTGRTVATLIRGTQDAGEHVVSWNASGAASGIYFVRLDAAEQHVMQKLLLIK